MATTQWTFIAHQNKPIIFHTDFTEQIDFEIEKYVVILEIWLQLSATFEMYCENVCIWKR